MNDWVLIIVLPPYPLHTSHINAHQICLYVSIIGLFWRLKGFSLRGAEGVQIRKPKRKFIVPCLVLRWDGMIRWSNLV